MHDIEKVIDRGMCVGCGACSVRTSGAVPVTLGRYGVYQASLSNVTAEDRVAASRVCPFSDESKNEDQLADARFGHLPKDGRIGHYKKIVAGRVTDDSKIVGSSSGGVTSLVLEDLLRNGEIDGVIHVGRAEGDSMFGYRLSHSPEEIRHHRKSFYYSTTMAEVLLSVRKMPGRYAIVGVPCFIKAARLLAESDPLLAQRLALFVGILCGHLKSQFFAESLAWQAGIEPGELKSIDFRVKNAARPANRYDYAAVDNAGTTHTNNISQTVDGVWGYGAFQPEACNFCDDVFAESADVALGDAWLPKYQAEWRGTNVAVIRDDRVLNVLQVARDEGRLILDDLGVDQAAETQGGNFRHRREGLSVRLADDVGQGLSVPLKRVDPGYPVPPGRVKLIRQRRNMSRMSLTAFESAIKVGSLGVYTKPMRREISKYKRIDAASKGVGAYISYVVKTLMKLILRKK